MAEEKAETKGNKNLEKLTSKLKENPWMIFTMVFGLSCIILLVLALKPSLTGNVIAGGDASDKLVEYLNSMVGGGVEYVSYEDLGNIYGVSVKYQGQEIPVYVTKDGKYFIQGISPMTGQAVQQEQQTQTAKIPKSDKPLVDLYVMSFCPYGNRAENTMLPVYNLLKDKVDWNIHFIVSISGSTVSSLHGQAEVTEDEREACVLANNGVSAWFKFSTYVNNNCGSDGTCWEKAASSAGINANAITSCVNTKGLSLMQAEEAASNAAGASGSPTMFINGVESTAVYQYENSQAYLDAVCSAFNTAPAECSQTLSGSTTTSTTTTGASCS